MSKCFVCDEPATTQVNGQWFCDEHASSINNGPKQGGSPITLMQSLAFVGIFGIGSALTGVWVLKWVA